MQGGPRKGHETQSNNVDNFSKSCSSEFVSVASWSMKRDLSEALLPGLILSSTGSISCTLGRVFFFILA